MFEFRSSISNCLISAVLFSDFRFSVSEFRFPVFDFRPCNWSYSPSTASPSAVTITRHMVGFPIGHINPLSRVQAKLEPMSGSILDVHNGNKVVKWTPAISQCNGVWDLFGYAKSTLSHVVVDDQFRYSGHRDKQRKAPHSSGTLRLLGQPHLYGKTKPRGPGRFLDTSGASGTPHFN